MASKFVISFALFAATNAGLFPAYSAGPAIAAPLLKYSPASEVSHSYTSFAAPAALNYAAPVANAVSYAPAGIAVNAPAFGATQQSIHRSFAGTVSQYSKAVDTPFSSVRKYDTRINNNVYTPAIAKPFAYTAQAPTLVAHAAPAVVAHAAPVVYSAHAPTLFSAHARTLYSADATPAFTAYATKPVSFSPASAATHVSFNGYGANYAW